METESAWTNNIQLYSVAPSVPKELVFLETLSHNLWWCWNHDAIELFRRINPSVWKNADHNPIKFLNAIPQKRFEELAEDDGFLAHLARVEEKFNRQIPGSASDTSSAETRDCIAYFSLEFGIHESIRIYAGGLGCLAGDHLKSASDMGLPLVGIGLLYRQGYFRQYMNADGWQQESFQENEIHCMPARQLLGAGDLPLQVSVPVAGGHLHASVWRMDVGRVPLFLLDTNLPDNPPEFRGITARLYDSDRLMRFRQELLLGLGGFRALVTLGYVPSVCHMNEGHAAFTCLGRIEYLMKEMRFDLDTAIQISSRTSVFTTHTPVPAGNETFDVELVKPRLAAIHKELGIDPSLIISWAQQPAKDKQHEICMTALGHRMALARNGVSKLHGMVERKMWAQLWPRRPQDEIPIDHVTNGIHMASWLSSDNAQLFDKYLGPEWRDDPSNKDLLARVEQIPDDELWKAHEIGRGRLVRSAREVGEKQYAVRSARRAEVDQMKGVLQFDTLTLGFARRFASYKRATLLLRDPDRLEAILTDEDYPVQIVFAGKAHPADETGKNLIKEIIEFAKRANLRQKILFLEDYDIRMARYLVQGVDVWLNTPRRPQEASGTSGMKAGLNGALNLSILDGWWDEGYSPECGWAIGAGEEYDNTEYQDSVEAQTLYNLLENEITPLFYDRKDGDVPVRWIRMMKASMQAVMREFTSHRMLAQYNSKFYQPAIREYAALLADDARRARELVRQRTRLLSCWEKVKIDAPRSHHDMLALHVGDRYRLSSEVHLGELRPDEVDVEAYYGLVDAENRPVESHAVKMAVAQDRGNGNYLYECEIACSQAGRYGFTARVTPQGGDWRNVMPGFITWAGAAV